MRLYTQTGFFLCTLWAMLILNTACQSSDPIDFGSQIKPILNKHCISCHGGVKKNGGFSLLFKEEAFANTESGVPAIIPGNASRSEFIKRLHEEDPELRMPYEKPKLSDEEINLLTEWINQGAQWGQHWAYTLPEKVEIPKLIEEAGFSGDNSSFVKNGIDQFILNRLQKENIEPSPSASKQILARRVALDITGLPPDTQLFQNYKHGDLSYETMVDSLLAKPTFGENWASWWLDMARYADTKGYEKDLGRTMWQYRDWVIKSFNQDMPYDQFTIEQLAGDLLPDPSIDQLIATAFHRNTMNNDEGGTDDEEFRVAAVIDRVNTTFDVWQSTTMGCVQCHGHPYDPFKQKDYYNLMAFFNNTGDEDTPNEAPALRFYSPEQQDVVDKVNNWVSKHGDSNTVKGYKDFLRYTEPVYKSHSLKDFDNGSYDDHASAILWNNGSCRLENVWTHGAEYLYFNHYSNYNGTSFTIRKDNAEGEILTQFTLNKTEEPVTKRIPIKKVDGPINIYIEISNRKIPKTTNALHIYWFAFLPDIPGSSEPGFSKIQRAFDKAVNFKAPILPVMAENPKYMARTTQVFERGNWLLLTDTVHPATPPVLNSWQESWPKDRLGFSKWLVDKKNPLTARTLVNRVWHQIFGRGLVSTVEDIGSQSDFPSHPELLDWLALRFMNEHQWSIKSLVKEIVSSGTYRQKSELTPDSYQSDPENEFYARGPRQRLSAEQIRDQALAISGLLSSKMYGPGVMPPQPEGVWQTVYSGEQWLESKGEDRYRRAVYTYLKRTSPYPSFITFDAGSREVCTIRRTVTNTPLQALVTLNDPAYLEASYHLAKNMQSLDNVEEQLAYGYERATLSKIAPKKLNALKELYAISVEEFKTDKDSLTQFLHFDANPTAELAALTVVANAIMNLDEFLTKA
ncbi:PSD1 and planctomycete cytochrome C domain-containing protein [Flagellimonas pacifica]|uniref:Planctomycete cytochrome C n=1 Tax=Flagellimonas pacifica TaxID=1247520 RepID=A0A285M7M7_9FLAO|nr:PSD1 and planctomycete cytochrome C domain-containing protein [Allomuricauda parva]SNY91966.1 Planctomycete cytochrome C [Allomuricauda parva]